MRKLFFFVLMFFVFLFVAMGMMAHANSPPNHFQVGVIQCDLEPGGGDKIGPDEIFSIAYEERDEGYLSSVPSEDQIKFLYDNIAADEAIITETECLIYDDDSRFLLTAGFEVNTLGQEEPMNQTGGNRSVWIVNIGNDELDPGV